MRSGYNDPKYAVLVEILRECATSDRSDGTRPSGYGIDVSDIDIEWLYDKLVSLGANLEAE